MTLRLSKPKHSLKLRRKSRFSTPSLILLSSLAFYPVSSPALAQETINTRIGKLTFESGYPSKETVKKLYDEMDFQRAAQAYIWGIPAVGPTSGAGLITTSSVEKAARC